jgi:hypothetical protein
MKGLGECRTGVPVSRRPLVTIFSEANYGYERAVKVRGGEGGGENDVGE